MQYFRSPRVHTNTKKNVEDFKQSYEAANDMTTNFLTNMMMVYFAERMALNITQHFKSSILLYKNQTGVPFITGDTPIVCLTGQEMNGMSIFHYPISPIIAMELIIIPKYSDWATISKNFVMELNQEFVDVVKNCNCKLATRDASPAHSEQEAVGLFRRMPRSPLMPESKAANTSKRKPRKGGHNEWRILFFPAPSDSGLQIL